MNWLNDLRALAETLNFSRAAERRNITQPAFGRRIKALEDWAGCRLIDRSTHRLSLTPEGEIMLAAAGEIIARLEKAKADLESARTAGGVLTFASTHALSFTFFPTWFRNLGPSAAATPVRLLSDNMIACEKLMADERADFLLCHHHGQAAINLAEGDFKYVTLASDTLVPVSRRAADGGPEFRLPGTEAHPVPLLGFDEQSGMGRIVRAALPDLAALHVKPVFTSHLAMVLKALAQDGKGIAWTPRSLADQDMEEHGTLSFAGGPEWFIDVTIILMRPRRQLSALAEEFWGLAERRVGRDSSQNRAARAR
ncbi:LysR family transcriptional regulator [Agaricicola taiwanensis]|uniref:LysR family transcriptional regulator n=1 Tax=Agaricicola taiwanensis TaxID=591372 RepID=UPI001E31790E|nr:LysR family transcriptional regulator [Agaricicola taiwanensis]